LSPLRFEDHGETGVRSLKDTLARKLAGGSQAKKRWFANRRWTFLDGQSLFFREKANDHRKL